ncbi:hypothetical protein Tco_1336945 [Tanacetum coccineum]
MPTSWFYRIAPTDLSTSLNSKRPDSLNSAAGGKLLERSTSDVLMISKTNPSPHSRNIIDVFLQVKSSDVNSSSSSEIAKLTHAVNQQTSVVISMHILRGSECGFNILVHSFLALSTLRRFSLRTASAAAKPCQGDSLEFYDHRPSIILNPDGCSSWPETQTYNLVELESNNDDVYDDPFDSKEDKIKGSKLLIDELDPPRSSDFLPSPKCDSNLFEVTIRATPDKNVKKTSISNASLILEDFNPPLYELPFHKEVPGSETLLLFSSKNEEKFSTPGFSLLKEFHHFSSLQELSHRALKLSKIAPNFEASRAHGFVLRSLELHILKLSIWEYHISKSY